MKVILITDVDKLGYKGDIKEVKKGFAANYLIPNKLALQASKQNLKRLEEEKRQQSRKEAKVVQQAKELKEKIEKTDCTIQAKVGEDEKLFGSITAQQIIDKVKSLGLDLDKKQLEMQEPLKKLGIYHIPIRLHPEVKADLKVWVAKE
ncbi:MAG: 50S ribosomal protein L9 [Spirochaetes bacterium]|nr:50S ribosomal protein L9 [Spirochaetota bacterium]